MARFRSRFRRMRSGRGFSRRRRSAFRGPSRRRRNYSGSRNGIMLY